MTRRKNAVLALGILVMALVISVVLVRMRPRPPRTAPPPSTPAVATVPAELLEGPLVVTGNGTVRPRAEIELAPQVGGRVSWVSPSLVSGSRVEEGQPLFRIEEADYLNDVRQARAQVAQDEVAVLEAEEEARIARREYEQFLRRTVGDGDGGVGRDSVAQATGLVFREPQLEAARASLERALAQLADAELALERTTVVAPFDGVVRTENVDLGAFRNAGQTVATLYASDAVEVVVPVTDEEASLLPGLWAAERGRDTVGLPARVRTRFGEGTFTWAAYVHRAEAALDAQSRTLNVVVRVRDPFVGGEAEDPESPVEGPPLLVGQYVEAELEGREGRWLRLPRRALRTGNEVWVVEDGQVRIVPVRLLQRLDQWVYVTGDLTPGAAVITEGVDLVTEGMEVRLREES